MADAVADVRVSAVGRRPGRRALMRKKSIIAFLFALPLILIVAVPGDLSGALRDQPGDDEQVDAIL